MEFSSIILPILFFVIALLYSSVGHAGASGYLAIMAIAEISPPEMRSSALIMNILVASISSVQYIYNKRFSLSVFLTFAIFSVPFSFLGGRVILPNKEMKIFLGAVLLLSAFVMVIRGFLKSDYTLRKLPIPVGVVSGSTIGFLSGLTSVGGGIFLTPLLIFFRWATIKNTSGISALFILVNSISGLVGQFSKSIQINESVWIWSLSVILGGLAGSTLGAKKMENKVILGALFCVLIIASIKMFII
ncbi:MAG: sulfite exporter TauE/SafE family protein [Leptospiraceae bacterium]|nr:sulfite exporter TauE/SafE family protein [Leptospiraceae bacterium]MCK6379874.1 sulfite exporter TauE/SafE family protein [Leptospiraceae bacterium]NUM41569.1 sulfite exporter TauE/SafE family protein [Leptospiraceae bacterium]